MRACNGDGSDGSDGVMEGGRSDGRLVKVDKWQTEALMAWVVRIWLWE